VDQGAPAQVLSLENDFRHLIEQFRTRTRIGIHEDEPVAGGRSGAGIAGAGNLVDRANSAVRSVELLSHTINSVVQPRRSKARRAALTDCRVCTSSFSSLKAGITTDIFMETIKPSGCLITSDFDLGFYQRLNLG
jgi:hypothetical protein